MIIDYCFHSTLTSSDVAKMFTSCINNNYVCTELCLFCNDFLPSHYQISSLLVKLTPRQNVVHHPHPKLIQNTLLWLEKENV